MHLSRAWFAVFLVLRAGVVEVLIRKFASLRICGYVSIAVCS